MYMYMYVYSVRTFDGNVGHTLTQLIHVYLTDFGRRRNGQIDVLVRLLLDQRGNWEGRCNRRGHIGTAVDRTGSLTRRIVGDGNGWGIETPVIK